jgi:hypothetical protein
VATTVTYAGSRHPEYSHVHQYTSDLAARGSSTQHLMQASAFILPGLMTAAFGVLLGLTVGRVTFVDGRYRNPRLLKAHPQTFPAGKATCCEMHAALDALET